MVRSSIKKSGNAFIVYFIIFFLLLTKGLQFAGWRIMPILSNLRYIAIICLPIYTTIKYGQISHKQNIYSKNIILYFIYACIITFCLRNLFYGGGLGYGLECNLFVASIFCSYFVFHYLCISERALIKALSIISLIVLVIQIVQQIFPDQAMFSMYTEQMREEMGLSSDYITGQRNGLYRFIPISVNIPVFLICYYFAKTLSNYKLKYLVLVSAFLVSMYLMLTRMFMVCTGICCLYILFSIKSAKKTMFMSFALIIGVIVISYFYADALFGELFTSEESGIDVSSKARLGCVPFFLSQTFDNPVLFLFGHGYPEHLWKWGANLGYWYNDIGILGQLYTYGVIWVFVYFKLVYWLLVKMKRKIPIYLRAYILGMLCICYMMPSYAINLEITLLWCIILYIADLYISKSDGVEHNTI